VNMNQMEKVADNPEVRFVVEWKEIDQRRCGHGFQQHPALLGEAQTRAALSSAKSCKNLGTRV